MSEVSQRNPDGSWTPAKPLRMPWHVRAGVLLDRWEPNTGWMFGVSRVSTYMWDEKTGWIITVSFGRLRLTWRRKAAKRG